MVNKNDPTKTFGNFPNVSEPEIVSELKTSNLIIAYAIQGNRTN